MGFTIFEEDGTFVPKDHGLAAGDLLHVVVVGGGAGGAGVANIYTVGSPGGMSSFGGIVTAEGGLCPSDNNAVEPQSNSFRGASGVVGRVGVYYSSGTTTLINKSVYGGGGADGWMPGVCKGRSGLPSTIFANAFHLETATTSSSVALSCEVQDNEGHVANFAWANGFLSAIPASTQRAGSGGVYWEVSNALAIGGVGGIGYGAGGGGGADCQNGFYGAGAGGNSGAIVQKAYVLKSTDTEIDISIGKGGAGGTGYAGGKGADGCVAIFW